MSSLPILNNNVYSSFDRPRREKKIPRKYWGCLYRCVEFPEGVYIDEFGKPRPDIDISSLSLETFADDFSDDSSGSHDELDESTNIDESDESDNEYRNECDMYLRDDDYTPSTTPSNESEFLGSESLSPRD